MGQPDEVNLYTKGIRRPLKSFHPGNNKNLCKDPSSSCSVERGQDWRLMWPSHFEWVLAWIEKKAVGLEKRLNLGEEWGGQEHPQDLVMDWLWDKGNKVARRQGNGWWGAKTWYRKSEECEESLKPTSHAEFMIKLSVQSFISFLVPSLSPSGWGLSKKREDWKWAGPCGAFPGTSPCFLFGLPWVPKSRLKQLWLE